jgi:hypothetical protein
MPTQRNDAGETIDFGFYSAHEIRRRKYYEFGIDSPEITKQPNRKEKVSRKTKSMRFSNKMYPNKNDVHFGPVRRRPWHPLEVGIVAGVTPSPSPSRSRPPPTWLVDLAGTVARAATTAATMTPNCRARV